MSVLRPVVDLIEDTLSLRSESDPAARLERIRTGLALAEVSIPDGAELVASLLGIPSPSVMTISSELRLERTVEVGVDWLIGLSRKRPLVLLIEDLHWCDPTTLDALGRLIDRISAAPIFLLLTARTEFGEPWQRPDVVTTLPLKPLEDSEVRELVATLGGGRQPPCPGGGAHRDVGRWDSPLRGGGGSVRPRIGPCWLAAKGPGTWLFRCMDLEIPTTLQGSLLARLDRLGPAKSVVQVAAVLGRTFTFDLLATVSGMDAESLAQLLDRAVDSGLLLPAAPENESGFIFKHVLVQEVAYESLLRRSRRTIHERVARVLDAQRSAGATSALEVVARHYEAAGLLQGRGRAVPGGGDAGRRRLRPPGGHRLPANGGSPSPANSTTGTRAATWKSRCSWPWGPRSPPAATPIQILPPPTTAPGSCANCWATTSG